MIFWKKKSPPKTSRTPALASQVIVIPAAFYGGIDPVIHYEMPPDKEHLLGAVTKKASPKEAVKKAEGSSKKKIRIGVIIGGLILFLIFLVAVAWYYLHRAATRPIPETGRPIVQSEQPSPPSPAETSTTQSVVTPTTTPVVSTTTVSSSTTLPVSLRDHLGEWPTLNTLDAPDCASKGLTDQESALFGLDSCAYDSDKDGYPDGEEVINLYDPNDSPDKVFYKDRPNANPSPTLYESGMVKNYASPSSGYRVYYPTAWESAPVDPNGDQVLFSGTNGDFVEIHSFRMNPGEIFESWFGRAVSGQQFTDLSRGTNRFRVDFWERKDHLVAYIPSGDFVFVLLYHQSTQGPVAYRHMMIVMTQSFRPSGVSDNMIPQIQAVFAAPSIATSTGA